MARQPRIAPNEYVYHVLTRGNNQMDVFHDEGDFARYREILSRYKEKFAFKLYHHALMTNHVHLVIEPSLKGSVLSQIMKSINLSYVQYYKRKYGHIGHFWQDRYKSIVISKDSYLLACGGYVELNPVRAGIVADPGKYRWSSYGTYAYGRDDGVTDRHTIYDELGAAEAERRRKYREYVRGWLKENSLRGLMNKRTVYGSKEFESRMQRNHNVTPIIRQRGRPKEKEDT